MAHVSGMMVRGPDSQPDTWLDGPSTLNEIEAEHRLQPDQMRCVIGPRDVFKRRSMRKVWPRGRLTGPERHRVGVAFERETCHALPSAR